MGGLSKTQKDPVAWREYMRAYRAANPQKIAAINKKAEATRNIKDPLKQAARRSVKKGVRCGTLIRPSICEGCGIACKPDAHHHLGYEHENWRKVRWLCGNCHHDQHH